MVVLSAARRRARAICRTRSSRGSARPASSCTASRSSPASRCASRVAEDKPVVVLPGFPTSAIFTFHAFVAPVIRALRRAAAGSGARRSTARVPVRIASELGRKEFVLVSLVDGRGRPDRVSDRQGLRRGDELFAGRRLPRHRCARLRARCRQLAEVTLIGEAARAPDLVIMGSHDVALDVVVGALAERGFQRARIAVGSLGGVAAARRGECDIAPVHLIDPASGDYNAHLRRAGPALVHGWRRMQGIVFRPGDARFEGRSAQEALAAALADPTA